MARKASGISENYIDRLVRDLEIGEERLSVDPSAKKLSEFLTYKQQADELARVLSDLVTAHSRVAKTLISLIEGKKPSDIGSLEMPIEYIRARRALIRYGHFKSAHKTPKRPARKKP